MANVLNRTTKQYLAGVELAGYPIADWIHDPDVDQLLADRVSTIYWTITGDLVSEMSPAEKAVVDAAIVAAREAELLDEDKRKIDDKVLRAFAEIVMEEINILRRRESLPDRTFAQLRNAIRNRIDTL